MCLFCSFNMFITILTYPLSIVCPRLLFSLRLWSIGRQAERQTVACPGVFQLVRMTYGKSQTAACPGRLQLITMNLLMQNSQIVVVPKLLLVVTIALAPYGQQPLASLTAHKSGHAMHGRHTIYGNNQMTTCCAL